MRLGRKRREGKKGVRGRKNTIYNSRRWERSGRLGRPARQQRGVWGKEEIPILGQGWGI